MRVRAAACAILTAFGIAGATACQGGSASDPTRADDDVDLPGVDTHEFTPREKHEFSTYVKELPAPCRDVAVPVAQCVIEKRPCGSCLPAAIAIAKAVREGMARDQVESLYKERFDPSSAKAIPLEGSPSRGPDAAPVTVVEFADFECPFCQRIAPELDAIWEQRKTSVRFVFKFMPLSMHPHSEIAARAAIAAQDQGKFWEMHHQLFSNGEHLTETDVQRYAAAIGLDLDRFKADFEAPATKARIDADHKLADDLSVKGTPTIFINGREYDSKVDISDWIDTDIAASASTPH
jgi:predicted DsbA family dithiol-disulfide isomerase